MQLSATLCCVSCVVCLVLLLRIWLLIKRGTEWNGTEWKKLIKHGTEQLSRHKVLPRAHGSRSYTHANCSCTRMGLLTRLAGNGLEADYSILAHNYLPAHGMVCKTQSSSIKSLVSPSLLKSTFKINFD